MYITNQNDIKNYVQNEIKTHTFKLVYSKLYMYIWVTYMCVNIFFFKNIFSSPSINIDNHRTYVPGKKLYNSEIFDG